MKNPGSHPSDFGFSTQPAFLVSPAEGLESEALRHDYVVGSRDVRA